MARNENFSQTGISEKHLLLIRLSAMGDVAMLVPVISAFRQQYPTVKLTILTRSFFRPIFSNLENVKVVEADVNGRHKGILGLWKLFKELQVLRTDAVLDMHNVLRSNILGIFFRITGIPWAQIHKGRKEKKALTSGNKAFFKPLKTTHERYADVFRSLGYTVHLSHVVSLPKQPITPKIAALVKIGGKRKTIGIAPFAAYSGKTYPLTLMETLIRELKNTKRYRILLFGGGAQEQQILEKWAYRFTKCYNIAGQLTFEEELAVISNLDVMVAMDSGNGHLAAMYGVPVITLWGITHPYAGFSPFQQDPENALFADKAKFPLIPTSIYGNKAPAGYQMAMETIEPKTVFLKIEAVVNGA